MKSPSKYSLLNLLAELALDLQFVFCFWLFYCVAERRWRCESAVVKPGQTSEQLRELIWLDVIACIVP